jgi:hypothetical protein
MRRHYGGESRNSRLSLTFGVFSSHRGYTEGSMIQVNQIRVERKEPFAIYSEHHLTGGE